jgi:branched-subunit amino acid aminotransferase/4-amino-4-deoxychorismate lyase
MQSAPSGEFGVPVTSIRSAATLEPTDLIWMNGDLIAWEDAKVHVLTHGLHYGTGVFEGVRCYDTELGPAVFRNAEHMQRLLRSAELYYMPVPYSADALQAATRELVARNNLSSCYIRPIVYRGYGSMGLNPMDAPVDVAIACWEWATYLGEEGMRDGIRAKVSSWRRISPDSLIPPAKASGQYLNNVLAKVESMNAGYQEAILLDDHGHVCEGTGENIYILTGSGPAGALKALGGSGLQCGGFKLTGGRIETDEAGKIEHIDFEKCTALGFPVNSLGDASGRCTPFKTVEPAWIIPGSPGMFAFPSVLYQQLQIANAQGNQAAIARLLHSLRSVLEEQARQVGASSILIDTSPFYAGSTGALKVVLDASRQPAGSSLIRPSNTSCPFRTRACTP